jgi:hypothetical protein
MVPNPGPIFFHRAFLRAHRFTIDYLMPAELFPLVILGNTAALGGLPSKTRRRSLAGASRGGPFAGRKSGLAVILGWLRVRLRWAAGSRRWSLLY